LRLIEAGLSWNNKRRAIKAVRAYDVEGASHHRYLGKQILPGWRIFRLDKIMSLNPTR
jgi:predicted phosphatase